MVGFLHLKSLSPSQSLQNIFSQINRSEGKVLNGIIYTTVGRNVGRLTSKHNGKEVGERNNDRSSHVKTSFRAAHIAPRNGPLKMSHLLPFKTISDLL